MWRVSLFPFPHSLSIASFSLHFLFIFSFSQSSYLSQISRIIFVEKKLSCGEIWSFFLKNLNNLWSIIKVYAVFVPNLCGEKSAWRKSVWRKNDKYEVWRHLLILALQSMTTMTTMTSMTTIITMTTVEGRGDCRTANSLRINHYKV